MNFLKDRRIEQCNKLFELVVSDSAHKLHHLLPPKNEDINIRVIGYKLLYYVCMFMQFILRRMESYLLKMLQL